MYYKFHTLVDICRARLTSAQTSNQKFLMPNSKFYNLDDPQMDYEIVNNYPDNREWRYVKEDFIPPKCSLCAGNNKSDYIFTSDEKCQGGACNKCQGKKVKYLKNYPGVL